MRSIRMTATILAAALLLLLACASGERAATGPPHLAAPLAGFTSASVESGPLGQVLRVSPPELDVAWRFALSPDGREIVASARRAGAGSHEPYRLHRLPLDGGPPLALPALSTVSAVFPAFSADGAILYYAAGGTIFRRPAAGGAGARMPGSGGFDCCPAPGADGTVAFVVLDAALRTTTSQGNRAREVATESVVSESLLWTMGALGEAPARLCDGGEPAWSPDGRHLAFAREGDLWLLDREGSNQRRLTASPGVVEGLPAFSPDGTRLVFVSDEAAGGLGGGNCDLWLLDLADGRRERLTGLGAWDSWPLWAEDGIYFLSGRGSGGERVQSIWKFEFLRVGAGN